MLCIELECEVIRDLTTSRYDDAMRVLQFEDIHHALEGEFVEVKTVAHIVVGGNGLWVVVDHHGAVAVLADGLERLYAAPVKLYRRTNTVCTRTEYYDRLAVVEVLHIVGYTGVGEVEVVGLSRELCCQCIYLFYNWFNAQR